MANISDDVPDKKNGLRIRAAFVRFLALGGDQETPSHVAGFGIIGAYIEGKLDLNACTVVGGLRFSKCRFEQKVTAYGASLLTLALDGSEVPGLTAEYCKTFGGVFLIKGFRSTGEVRLIGSQIGGALECTGGSFENGRGIAFNGQGMEVKQGLLWRGVAKVSGRIDLVAAHVATLADDMESWKLASDIVLDGFQYDRIDSKEIGATERVKWLKLQKPEQFGEKFWPQPWEHLTKILRAMGHTEDAKIVAMEKQRVLRELGLIGQKPTSGVGLPRKWLNTGLNDISSLLHGAYGILAGFGHRPLWTVTWMALVWVSTAGVYAAADQRGLFVPTNARLYADAQFERCGNEAGQQRWSVCEAMPPEYTRFSPIIYSLDVILPLLDLKQDGDWAPIVRRARGNELTEGHLLRILMWAEIIFGWITSLLLVSVLGRLIERD